MFHVYYSAFARGWILFRQGRAVALCPGETSPTDAAIIAAFYNQLFQTCKPSNAFPALAHLQATTDTIVRQAA